MLSWSLGGYPSPNLRIAQRILEGGTKEEALTETANRLYGPEAGPLVRQAWREFSTAFQQFPYCGNILYQGPQHWGPANLLYPRRTGYSATMLGFPYDDVMNWCGPYPPGIMATQFRRVADGWKRGEDILQDALQVVPAPRRPTLTRELRLARAIRLHFVSAALQIEFVELRDRPSTTDADRRTKGVDIVETELLHARRLYNLTKADSRIGFESSNQYYYVPLDLVEKVINCDWIAKQLKKP